LPKLTDEYGSALKIALGDERVLTAMIALVDDVRDCFTIGMTEKTNDQELADVLRYKGARKCAAQLTVRLKEYHELSKT
jgi:hypothetical protein